MSSASNHRANTRAQAVSKGADEDPATAAAKRLEQEQDIVRSKLTDQSFNPRRYGDPLAEGPRQDTASLSVSPELEQKWLRMLRAGRPSAVTP